MDKYDTFRSALEALINGNSMENGSDTPDFILAQYLTDCLTTFDRTVATREQWYSRPICGWADPALDGPKP